MEQSQYLRETNKLIYNLCSFFNQSCKRLVILTKAQEEYLSEAENPSFNKPMGLITPLDIRWLSFYPAYVRILELYPTIVIALQDIMSESKDEFANNLVLKLLNLEQIFNFCIMADILEPIFKLMKIIERKNITLDGLKLNSRLAF